ncbi:MAG: hypothetical protein ISR76_08040 [Planctomycetes bacterium]|nr:hypothetical protein [Planctomycetota bacterium]MBL7008933.1 hypothetical protein [Planctomycetota bacterium]
MSHLEMNKCEDLSSGMVISPKTDEPVLGSECGLLVVDEAKGDVAIDELPAEPTSGSQDSDRDAGLSLTNLVDLACSKIPGFALGDKRFVGKVKIRTLVGYLTENPTKFGDRKVPDGELDPESTLIRNAVQRQLAGAKKSNLGEFVKYTRRFITHGDGILPPMTLCSATNMELDEDGSMLIPHGQKLFALDGETQLAVWHSLWRQDRTTYGDVEVAVEIYYGRDEQWAQQAYCDLNGKGVHPTRNQVICRDHREKQTRIVDKLIKEVPLFRGGILRDKVSLPAKAEEVLTYTCLYDMVCAMLQKTHCPSRNYDYDGLDCEEATSKIISFFREFTAAFEEMIKKRGEFLISSQPAMLAIGAFAKKVLDSAASEDVVQVVMDRLLEVDWSNGDHWIGILLENKVDQEGNQKKKLRRKKDAAKDIFNALSEADSADGKAITKAPARKTSDA